DYHCDHVPLHLRPGYVVWRALRLALHSRHELLKLCAIRTMRYQRRRSGPNLGMPSMSRSISPMSALGQKQTCAVHQPTSALPPKTDMSGGNRDVSQIPKSHSWGRATLYLLLNAL